MRRLNTAPEGAKVYYRPYAGTEQAIPASIPFLKDELVEVPAFFLDR